MKRQLFILIILILSISANAQNDTTKQVEEEYLIVFVEQMPEFVGGIDALIKYLKSRAIYTEKANMEKVAGRVFVSFVVEIDVSITEPSILRGLHPDLDSISLAIIKNMPKWTPAKQRGKPIKCSYNLPIEFDFYGNKIENTQNFTTSKYWNRKGKNKFIKTCTSDFKKNTSECNCWLDFIVWNYNNMKLEELNLTEIFKTKKCN